MRGSDAMQESLFTVAKLDDFVPADHPLRSIRLLVNDALAGLNERFNAIYADSGRDSIAPEKLVRALLLQVFYSIRSERQLCEQLNYNLPFRWFVGLAIDDPVWNHSVFSKNRDRLLEQAVVDGFFAEVLRLADQRGLLSKEHFSVDGTLIQAWASQKSFRPKDGSDDQRPGGGGRNAQADWKGQPRTNDTHQSSTDPDARMFRKSHNTAAVLCYQGHVLMENRNGLVVSAVVTQADGKAERVAALAMLDALDEGRSRTLGADKAYDTGDFVAACRERQVTPHVACNDTRRGGSAIDGRTTRHPGYKLSQSIRKRIEEPFGWGKTVGRLRQTVFRGLRRVDGHFKLTMTANNCFAWPECRSRCRREPRDEAKGKIDKASRHEARTIGDRLDRRSLPTPASLFVSDPIHFALRTNFNSLLTQRSTGPAGKRCSFLASVGGGGPVNSAR